MDILLIAIGVAAVAFFLARWVQVRRAMAGLSQLETRRLHLIEAQSVRDKVDIKTKLLRFMVRLGYTGDVFGFVAGMAFLYLVVVLLMRLTGIGLAIAGIAALPLAFVIVYGFAARSAGKRRAKFNVQLVDLLELVAAQITGGNGAQRALEMVVPQMQEPIKSEMSRVLDTQAATRDLIGAMRGLAERYPSRAIDMFISALEIDRAEGHAIGPALQQSADLLKASAALAAEAKAEISQTKNEFFAVLGVLGLIAAQMLFNADATAQKAYLTPLGLTVVLIGAANVAFGIFRFYNLLNTTTKGEM